MKTKKTKIEFEYEGKEYVLEFTADSIKKMIKRGFDVNRADEQLPLLPEKLFSGAFIANHDDVKEGKRNAIYKELCAAADNPEADEADEFDEADGVKRGAIERVLILMFREAMTELNSHKGNVTWRIAN